MFQPLSLHLTLFLLIFVLPVHDAVLVVCVKGTEDTAISFEYARLSAQRIRQMNVTVNFTSLAGEGHVILDKVVIEIIETYIFERAPGTTQFLKAMVSDLTDTFSGDKQRSVLK